MKNVELLAYLAGALDSDGSFSIRKRVYADSVSPSYCGRVSLKQVTNTIPNLLRDTFGGTVIPGKPSTDNGRPLYVWDVTSKTAAGVCRSLQPFVKVKALQLEAILEIQESVGRQYKEPAYWFEKENPNWRDMELVTHTEVVRLLGYSHMAGVSSAIRNGTLLALPRGVPGTPRIPKPLVLEILARGKARRGPRHCPKQLLKWRERLFLQVGGLNEQKTTVKPNQANLVGSERLGYLAGAMDSDGCFSIRKSSYEVRKGESKTLTYTEHLSLSQVTRVIPEMLKATFGGFISDSKTGTGRPFHTWVAGNRIAANACRSLQPFVRLKGKQLAAILELQESKNICYRKPSYWFEKENPNWRDALLITHHEVAKLMGYSNLGSVAQAIRKETLVGLSGAGPEIPSVPKKLVLELAGRRAKRQGSSCPAQVMGWRSQIHQRVRELNKIGTLGTAVYHRTGPFKMKPV